MSAAEADCGAANRRPGSPFRVFQDRRDGRYRLFNINDLPFTESRVWHPTHPQDFNRALVESAHSSSDLGRANVKSPNSSRRVWHRGPNSLIRYHWQYSVLTERTQSR